ncbi:MAG: preprotein translocase subunit SecY [Bacillota bacterium]
MFQSLRTAWKLPDLRKKLLMTLLLLGIYRLGSHIPAPGIDVSLINLGEVGGLLNLVDMFAGGNLQNMTILALNVGPYITASIIFQLLVMVIPALERLQKDGGEEGRKKLSQYQRYSAIALAAFQAWALVAGFRSAIISNSYIPLIILVFTAGSMFSMWLGEKISEVGIGNGISLLIFVGIVSRLIPSIRQTILAAGEGGVNPILLVISFAISLLIIAGIVMGTQGERRIPIQYAKRVVGRRMYGGQTTHLPMKVNQAGVIPVIFASSLLAFPFTIAGFFGDAPWAKWITEHLGYTTIPYQLLYAILTFVFTFFYTAVTFNSVEVADNMKKYGGFVPGIRPGKPTSDYMEKVLTRVTFVGAVFLTAVAILPNLLSFIGLPALFGGAFGGTGLIIVVGVALDTMKQIEAQLLMRQYEGFLK